jgi:hypothetical protein
LERLFEGVKMHEVVNGANGSVTWCSGPPFCPRCVNGARACERVGAPLDLMHGQTVYTVLPAMTAGIAAGHYRIIGPG